MQESMGAAPDMPRMPSLFLGGDVAADGVPVLAALGSAQDLRPARRRRLLRTGSAIGLLAAALGVYAAFDFSPGPVALDEKPTQLAATLSSQGPTTQAPESLTTVASAPAPAAALISEEALLEPAAQGAKPGTAAALAEAGRRTSPDLVSANGAAGSIPDPGLASNGQTPPPMLAKADPVQSQPKSGAATADAKKPARTSASGSTTRKAAKAPSPSHKDGDSDVLLIETLIRLDKSGMAKADGAAKP